EAKRILTRDSFLAPSIGPLALEVISELHGVLVVNVIEVILQRPQRLIRSVPGGASPAAEFRKSNDGHVHVVIHGVGDANPLALPPAKAVGSPFVFVELVRADRNVIEHVRRNRPVVVHAVVLRIEPGVESIPQGNRQPRRAARAYLRSEARDVVEESEAMFAA